MNWGRQEVWVSLAKAEGYDWNVPLSLDTEMCLRSPSNFESVW